MTDDNKKPATDLAAQNHSSSDGPSGRDAYDVWLYRMRQEHSPRVINWIERVKEAIDAERQAND